MPALQLAVALEHFRQPLKQAIESAAEMKVAGIHAETRDLLNPKDLGETGRRQLRHVLAERNLRVAALRFPARRSFYDQEHLEGRVQLLQDAMQLAYDLRAKVVTTRIGRLPEDTHSEEYLTLQLVVSDLAAAANRVGVTLGITSSGDDPHLLESFISGIQTGPIGLDFDPAALIMSRANPVDVYRNAYQKVVHIAGRDAIRDVDGSGKEVAVGRGETDWDELLALIDQANYQGWVTVERSIGDDRIGSMQRAVTYLNRVGEGG